MSNTRRAKWTAAQITAGNAEALLGELAQSVAGEDPATRSLLLKIWDQLDADGRAEQFPDLAEQFRAQAARTVLLRSVVADYGVTDPAVVAQMEQAAMELGDEYWAGMYRQIAG